MKNALIAALCCLGTVAMAQAPAPAAPAAPAAAAPAPAPVSAAKKQLVARVLQLQQPGIAMVATRLAEQPVAARMQTINGVLQRQIPADKREALAKDIQADIKRYGDETVPLLREQAQKLAPTTVGTVLEQRLSEEELKKIITVLEAIQSAEFRKYQQLEPEMMNSLASKVVEATRASVEPKVRAMDTSIAGRLGIKPAEAGAAAPAAGASAPR